MLILTFTFVLAQVSNRVSSWFLSCTCMHVCMLLSIFVHHRIKAAVFSQMWQIKVSSSLCTSKHTFPSSSHKWILMDLFKLYLMLVYLLGLSQVKLQVFLDIKPVYQIDDPSSANPSLITQAHASAHTNMDLLPVSTFCCYKLDV